MNLRHWEIGVHNPYRDAFGVSDAEAPKIIEPALSLHDVDELVRLRLQRERYIFEAELRRARTQAWDEGAEAGFAAGQAAGRSDVGQLLGPVLSTMRLIARRLDERADAPKSTIAAERSFTSREAGNLATAISSATKHIEAAAS